MSITFLNIYVVIINVYYTYKYYVIINIYIMHI